MGKFRRAPTGTPHGGLAIRRPVSSKDETRGGSHVPFQALDILGCCVGLGDVVCESIEIPTRFSGFAELWNSFLGGTGPAPSYVATLERDRREALAEHLERSLPREVDRAICLVARAWAVRGVATS